ncbi:MAG: adenylosuccinate lyase [Bacteroidetes bacterium]|nr:adenylosuccinate lyase [Bacteroidota bacterium]MBP7399942.1 adenylosuccinate lyase [Chitinophagales bacterium]MBK8488367.1 adenylosuccinate lyase [Bacteroidota bacterium]MBK8681869.1 adenylosuccinate lyase [Bacteroidota bacterium]MBP8754447.1 adenylosuccinate lyase [Chitinophagales bacterium]
MAENDLMNISPIDGRYSGKVSELAPYFSEFGLFKFRLYVEIEYFISLTEIPLPQLSSFDPQLRPLLRNVYKKFDITECAKIKEIEKTINHDVKAVEYYIKEYFEKLGLQKYKEFIHFGLTSQDINNTAIPISFRDAVIDVYYPMLEETVAILSDLANKWSQIPMLARTHGQAASPTMVGKEIRVFIERLNAQRQLLNAIPFSAKFGGATGNFNAHFVAYPDIDWISFADEFVSSRLNLVRCRYTTQVEHYDNLAASFDGLKRINTILIDLCRDIWTYISMDYFKQTVNKDEVGSSAMPHKVNPIDFENAEGNLGIANAIFEHLSNKLPLSRLQRDLTDSTVLRNIGTPMAHTVIALKSIQKGLKKLEVNKQKIHDDLDNNWAVISEAIQTILRREGYPKPYEALKSLTRGNANITKESIQKFIDTLEVSNEIKEQLRSITPFNYTGFRYF